MIVLVFCIQARAALPAAGSSSGNMKIKHVFDEKITARIFPASCTILVDWFVKLNNVTFLLCKQRL